MRRTPHTATAARQPIDPREQWYRSILDNQREMICRFRADGTILFANRTYAAMLGVTTDELIGSSFWNYIDEADRPAVKALLEQLRPDAPEVTIENRLDTADGTRWTLWTNRALEFDADGRVLEAQSSGVDITERKEAEVALRNSEQRLRELVASLPAAVYTCDADGRILLYNGAAEKLWGRQPSAGEQWCGSWKLFNLDGSPMPHDRSPMAQTLRDGRAHNGEIVIERPDGTRRLVAMNPSPMVDDAGSLVGAANMLIDLTERRKAEQARALLAAIVSSSEDAIISKSLDGCITSWNSGARRLFGYDADEAVGQPITLLFPPDRLHEEEEIQARLRRGVRIVNLQTVRYTKSGEAIDVSITVSPVRDAQGNIVGASTIMRDITAQKRAEGALRESEQRLRAIIETAADGVITIDERGIVESVNPAAVRIFGYEPGAIIGQHVSVLMAEADDADQSAAVPGAFRVGGPRADAGEAVVHGRRRDGSTFPMELAASETRLDDGRRIFTGLVRDITERVRHEQKMKLVMQELNHRVKNTLAVAASTADQTMRHTDTLEQFKEAYSERVQSMAKAHRLLTRTEWEGAELHDLLQTELAHRVARPEQIQLDGPTVILDPNVALAMHMVVHELSTNAVKYGALSTAQGRVDVQWSCTDEGDGDGRLTMRWIESGGPTVEPPDHSGFGTRVIRQTLQDELAGEADMQFEPGGLKCTIQFPWTDRTRAGEGRRVECYE